MNFIRVRNDKAINPAHVIRAVWSGNEPGDGVLTLITMEPDDMGQAGEYRITGAMADVAWEQLTSSNLTIAQAMVAALAEPLSALGGALSVIAEGAGATVLLHEDLCEVIRQLKEIDKTLDRVAGV